MKNNQLNLSNTITGKKETFVPINPKKLECMFVAQLFMIFHI